MQWHLSRYFYAELGKKRERNGNFSHRSAHVVEASAHVLSCFQAPVHPCSLTCSLVWNQLQKAAVILCYSASPILKAAIKVWHWLKAIQLAVTVKQKPRVNWNFFLSFPSFALSGDTKVHPRLGKFLRGKDGRRVVPTQEQLSTVREKRTKEGEYTPGRGVYLSSVLLSSSVPL